MKKLEHKFKQNLVRKYKPWSLKHLKCRLDTLHKVYCVWCKQISECKINPNHLEELLRSIAFSHPIFYNPGLQIGNGKQFYFQNWNIIHINLWRKLNHWECNNGGENQINSYISNR